MRKLELHKYLLDAIGQSATKGVSVASILMEILQIGKEAAYRRIRGEVLFSFDEAAALSVQLGISLDNIVGENSPNIKPFHLKLTNYVDPLRSDLVQIEDFVRVLSLSQNDSYTEIGSSANLLPLTFCLDNPYLIKFFVFKWMYQTSGLGSVKSLKNISLPVNLYDAQKRYYEGLMLVKHTYFIWDRLLFQYLVTDIKFFANINYITKEDVVALKEDLLRFIDKMEEMATKGKYESGNSLQFYLSGINFESTYSYFQTDTINISYMKAFTLNSMISQDKESFSMLKQWIGSLKRLSTLISVSGEIERFRFFDKQRALINTLSDND